MLEKEENGFHKLETKKFEKIRTSIYNRSDGASLHVGRQIAELIRDKAAKGEYVVLGLATGSGPTRVYDCLIKFHKEGNPSFKNVITFNLDEYYPIVDPKSLQSYVRFMKEHLFDHIDIESKNVNIPDGTLTLEEIKAYCHNYDAKIKSYGGLDIQLLGIGRTGHIGFNGPVSPINGRTRLVRFDQVTRLDAASDFFGNENIPSRAITMGVGIIMEAKKVCLIAWGEGKANVIKESVEGGMKASLPAPFLQQHSNCEFIIGTAVAGQLTRAKTPWLVEECVWTGKLITKATTWLANKSSKAILSINLKKMGQCFRDMINVGFGSVPKIAIMKLLPNITGWVSLNTRPLKLLYVGNFKLYLKPYIYETNEYKLFENCINPPFWACSADLAGIFGTSPDSYYFSR